MKHYLACLLVFLLFLCQSDVTMKKYLRIPRAAIEQQGENTGSSDSETGINVL